MKIDVAELAERSNAFQLPQVVLVTDRGYLGPTLFTLWGILRHLSVPGTVHFWGDQLTESDWNEVKSVAQTNPLVTLQCLSLTDSDLGGRIDDGTRLPAAAMGRLRIAEKLSGRVLYMDGDTHVRGDISQLFSIDLNGCMIGAVRSFMVAKWSAKDLKVSSKHSPHIEHLQKLLGHRDISKHFNSGVLLIDTDAIRAEPEIYDAMRDVVYAATNKINDQDYLNKVFAGRTRLLNPSFNASWSRTRKQRANSKKLNGDAEECASLPDCIVHFHGTPKPWQAARKDLWKPRGRSVWRYRRELKVFRRLFPSIAI